MISHPIVIAVVAADAAALLLLVAASLPAIRLLLRWHPEEASQEQLSLERAAEVLSIQGRAGVVLFVGATVLLLIAIASVLPGVVPGAMCGTGVVEAMGSTGTRMGWMRALAIVALCGWHLLDKLNRSCPTAPVTTAGARSLLIAFPVLVLAVIDTGRVLLTLDVQTPVDCCAVVYDAVRTSHRSSETVDSAIPWIWLMTAGSIVVAIVAVLGWSTYRKRQRSPASIATILGVFSIFWVCTAYFALVRELAAYHYGVLAHDCPWCLFAGRHHAVGYLLFGALAVVGLEGMAVALATITSDRIEAVRASASCRASQAVKRLMLALLCFLVIALLPAVLWRLRHGVWITG